MITDQMDRHLRQRLADAWIAQGPQLLFALCSVAGRVIRINVARVTAQFREAVSYLRRQHSRETFDAELLQVRPATPLAVKFREIADRRMLAQGQAVLLRQLQEQGKRLRVAMHVVVRIEMRRPAVHQLQESSKLPAQLVAQRARGAGGECQLLPKIDMQSHT